MTKVLNGISGQVRSAASSDRVFINVVDAPPWAVAWAGGAADVRHLRSGIELTISMNDQAALVSARVRHARLCDGQTFRQVTLDVYRAIRESLDHLQHRSIVRMWNHIPGIHDALDPDCDRYKHFNAGRFAAMCEWFGGAENIADHVPAASGIGHDGQDLVVHALSIGSAARAVENPRQIPAFRYSRRYGPLPPCFARATVIDRPQPSLLLAGTAAITGEESCHVGDLSKQLELTLENLRHLMRAAGVPGAAAALRQIQFPRVYVSRIEHASQVARSVCGLFGGEIEMHRADLCRQELLVEIEGVVPFQASRD